MGQTGQQPLTATEIIAFTMLICRILICMDQYRNLFSQFHGVRRGRDRIRMVVGFTTTYAMSAYQ
jgi:hypothetical protein